MNTKNEIKKEVLKTLDCFDQVERLKPEPYFFRRVKNRIDNTNVNDGYRAIFGTIWSFSKPALVITIIFLNIFTATVFWKNRHNHYSHNNRQLAVLFNDFIQDSKPAPFLFIDDQE